MKMLPSLGLSAFFIYKDFLSIQVKGRLCPASPCLMRNSSIGEENVELVTFCLKRDSMPKERRGELPPLNTDGFLKSSR